MEPASERVVIGMDPHKRSVTIEVMAADERVLGGGRFGTDLAGYRSMLDYVHRWQNRVAAIEGCNDEQLARTQHTPCWAEPNPLNPGRFIVDSRSHPAWICGRRRGSGSARRTTSRVTGATSPTPKNRNRARWSPGLPSVHSK